MLAAPAPQLLLRHAVLSSVTLRVSSKDALVHFLMLSMYLFFPRHHSENACLNKITPIVSTCLSKESHFSFDNLGKEFTSCLKFIQYALVCPFVHPIDGVHPFENSQILHVHVNYTKHYR